MDLFGSRLDTSGSPGALEQIRRRLFGGDVYLAEQQQREALARMQDNAPVGAVGAPGGLLASSPPVDHRASMQGLLDAASMAPGLGDIVGPLNDAQRLYLNPEERTPVNYGLAGLGALPFVPSFGGLIHSLDAPVYRGSAEGVGGEFWSRSEDYARGFDRGQFRSARVQTDRPLSFADEIEPHELAGLWEVMRKEGDGSLADLLEGFAKEDGALTGAEVYQMLEINGAAAPEYYLRRAGFDAIDTGRDVRVLNPEALRDR